MLIGDITPGRYYQARLSTGATDAARCEGFDDELVGYGGRRRVKMTRFLARGPTATIFLSNDVIAEIEPTDRQLRVFAACEQVAGQNAA